MNHVLMRIIDKYIGVPICFALSLMQSKKTDSVEFEKIQALKEKKNPKVLIIHMSEMGAMVLAQPGIQYLKSQLPGCQVYYLVFPLVKELLCQIEPESYKNIYTVDPSNAFTMVNSTIQSIIKLKQINMDAVVDFEWFSRFSSIMSHLIAPNGVKSGLYPFNLPHLYRGDLLTCKVHYSDHMHTSKLYLALVNAILSKEALKPECYGNNTDDLYNNYQSLDYKSNFEPSCHTIKSVKEKLSKEKAQGPYILINPNDSKVLPQRNWSVNSYVDLCRALAQKYPKHTLVLVGISQSKADKIILNSCQGLKIATLVSKTTMGELLALFTLADLLITSDSGPAHLATLTNTPCVVLFGPETPLLFAPLHKNTINLYANTCCSPCINVYSGKKIGCLDNKCMGYISTEKVLQSAEQLLKR